MDDLVFIGLAWLATGTAVWAIFDPARFDDHAVRWYVAKRKRLPSVAWLLCAHVAVMVAGPWLLVVAVVKAHRKVWSR